MGSLCKRDPTGQPGTTAARLRGLTAPLTLLSTEIHLLGKQLWDPLQRLQGLWIRGLQVIPAERSTRAPTGQQALGAGCSPCRSQGKFPKEPGGAAPASWPPPLRPLLIHPATTHQSSLLASEQHRQKSHKAWKQAEEKAKELRPEPGRGRPPATCVCVGGVPRALGQPPLTLAGEPTSRCYWGRSPRPRGQRRPREASAHSDHSRAARGQLPT